MEINCCFAPTTATPDHLVIAEELGYTRGWLFDSPALYADAAATIALAAARTSKIRLGIAVITEHLRHLVSNAGMVAHAATLAPGRFDVAFGTGFTSAALVGRAPSRWSRLERYVEAFRELLAGREVEWDGRVVGLLHGPASGVQLPVEVSLWLAAQGPRGYAAADRLGVGVFTHPGSYGTQEINLPQVAGPMMIGETGTVLDDDETVDSSRVMAAAGPCAAVWFHFGSVGPLAGTAELAGHQAMMGEIDESRRHLALHRGHVIEPNEVDRQFLTPDVIRRTTTTLPRSDWGEYVGRLEDAGAMGIVYQPAGPDIPRELRAFREAAASRAESIAR